MKDNYHTAKILKMHIKQYLNKMAALDKLCNSITNKTDENSRQMSHNNHLNLESAIDDTKRSGLVRFAQEGNMHGEKCMQIGKA